jgi:hypothetical protein
MLVSLMFKRLIVAFLLCQSLQASFLTQSENALLDYLSLLVTTTAVTNNTYLDPWIVCKNAQKPGKKFSKDIFMSSPLLEAQSKEITELDIFRWIAVLLEQGNQFNIRQGTCRYRFEYFGKCILEGIFSITFDGQHISFFEIMKKPEACSFD